MLEPEDFAIGSSLSDLASTLVAANKLEEALIYSQRALDHRLGQEGCDSWYISCEHFTLARILYRLDRDTEALTHHDALLGSLSRLQELDEDEQWLQAEAIELRKAIT